MNKKAIFDTVRAMLGRGFTQPEVDALDAAIDSRTVPDPPTVAEHNYTPRTTGDAGIAIMKRFEGYAKVIDSKGTVKAYPDPASGGAPWTIGFGATTDEDGKPIKPGTIWTQKRAKDRFKLHLKEFEGYVIDYLGDSLESTSQAQFDALVSFVYNLGPDNFRRSTLLKKHKAGDYRGAAQEFVKWNKAAGRVMHGLTRRRKAEAELYRSGS